MVHSILADLGVIIVAATALALVAKGLRQPLLLGYVAAGMLLGPVLGLVRDQELILSLSELGLAFLLFTVGLKVDLGRLRRTGRSAAGITMVQVGVSYFLGYGIASWLGFGTMTSIYLGLAVAFSSTMIVLKLLSDKDELETVYGRMAVSVLLIQDVFVVLALSLLSSLGAFSYAVIADIVWRIFALVGITYIINRYILRHLLALISTSYDIMYIGTISISFIFAGLAEYLGFSMAIGAFIAGVSLGPTIFNIEIESRIKALRDFFVTIFFVSLGMLTDPVALAGMARPMLFLLAAVVLVKPVIIFALMKLVRYSNRASFFSGAMLGQVSEFALIIAVQGLALGHLTGNDFSLITMLTISTIIITTYVINFDNLIYNAVSPFLKPIAWVTHEKEPRNVPKTMKDHIVIFGVYKIGKTVIRALEDKHENFVVVDFNPEKAQELVDKKIKCVCGDMNNREILDTVHVSKAHTIISAVTNLKSNLALLRKVREANPRAVVFMSARTPEDAIKLYESGADYVVVPELLGGEKIVSYLRHLNEEGIRRWGGKHYDSLVRKEFEPR